MDAARKFVDKGQIDKAVKEYLRIVHEDPKDVRVWLKIGDLYAKKGAKQDAIETYLKVARFYHDQGFFLKAVAVYKQILKIDPRLVDVILKLAELYRQLGLMSDAMQHFESVAAHFHREGNTKEALATVKKLVDLDPENIATRIKLAELYSKESLVAEAATEFTIACEQLRRQNRQDDFLKVAERLLWHKPDNQALNRELAGLYLVRNDPRRALQKLQTCFKADPRDVETLGLLAQAFQALDQKAKTVSVLKELARIHNENNHKPHAGEVFRKILELVPNDADAIAFLGPAAAPPVRPSTPIPPVAVPHPPPPLSRPVTPMPSQIRASTADARFNLTTDLPSYSPASARMTGSMPLIDEQSLSGVDFALPEYDDSDFSADMEPPPDPRQMSAAGERHAEEISKILAETDVYVKYGLHQKAVDHLRRVFTLDGDNVEARERLKDIFISQNREQEAEVELLRLAELVAPADPDRAEIYLQELLTLNGTHTGAFDLARRFRLRVARMSSASAEVEIGHHYSGGVAITDADDDFDLGVPSRKPPGRVDHQDSIDDFDPDELIGKPIAHGSPAPGRPPQRPLQPAFDDDAGDPDAFDIDFGPSPSQATRQLSPAVVEALVARQLDAQLSDAELGDDIDRQVAHELGRGQGRGHGHDGEDLPFDPDEARAFDAAVPRTGDVMAQTDAIYISGFEKTEMPPRAPAHAVDTSSYDAAPDDALHPGGYDPYGTEAIQTPASYADPTAAHAVGGFVPTEVSAVDLQRPDSSAGSSAHVEDELEDAEFYVGQGMYAEAADLLHALLARYPSHRMVIAKLREVEALASGHGLEVGHDSVDQPAASATDAINIDDIEEVGFEDLVELDGDSRPVAQRKRQPTVMLEKPLDDGDSDTHYDLGLAYKEMALLDDAIKAFEKALRAPGREVQCRVMIGMCLREIGNPSEAIHQFKSGLHAEPSERERQSLYYEIGMTYEALGDDAEALYYFEMVVKRDPGFADAAVRSDRLRARGGRAMHSHDDDI
ncbi:MAG TPA: tetratricopeptide repeat protein [Kofleriaceae bacterium]|nr:tetratricopeptide repeat protein [Kofleriaceae bacterium]